MEVSSIPVVVVLLLVLGFWLWALLHLSKSHFKNPTYKILWLLAILFFPVIGSILYFMLKKDFITGRKRKFNPNFRRKQ